MFEFIFSIIWEVVLQFIGEILFNLGFRTLAEPFRAQDRRRPVVAAVGVLGGGALAGLVSVLLLPTRIVGVTGVPGSSLVLSPIVNAVVMESVGRLLAAQGRRRPYVATYWAGGLFAFGMALVRFFVIEP